MPIDSNHCQLSIDAKSATSYKKTMEEKIDSQSVAKKAAPSSKMIAALVTISKIRMYQHRWLESSNLVEIMSCQLLSDYHVDVLKFNNAIGRLAVLKNGLNIRNKNPNGICRDFYRPSSLVPRKVCYYFMERGDLVKDNGANGKKPEQWYTAIKYLPPASSNTTRSSRRSMEEAESSHPTKGPSSDKSEDLKVDADEEGPLTKKKKSHYKEQEGESPATTVEAFQEIVRNISTDDLQSLKLLVDKELFDRQSVALVSLPSYLRFAFVLCRRRPHLRKMTSTHICSFWTISVLSEMLQNT